MHRDALQRQRDPRDVSAAPAALRALERHELWSTGIPFQLFLWACFCGKPDSTSQIML
jgi:hypothetical protein